MCGSEGSPEDEEKGAPGRESGGVAERRCSIIPIDVVEKTHKK
jgi:hypothetical protein